MEKTNVELEESKEFPKQEIKKLIYIIRDRQVMLDSDVANLFQYETKALNRNVKNNIERFPEYYCFQLTEEEYKDLRCKNFTLNKNSRGQHRKYLPYVFTEHGITMLAGLLKSSIAINASIRIVDTFIEMRKIILSNEKIFERLTSVEYKLLVHDKKIDELFKQFKKEDNIKQKIFFKGQIYDSYSLIIDIIKRAKIKIIIIDNYIDESVLKILTKKNVGVETILITSNKSNISKLDVEKFNQEYPLIRILKNSEFHDRFIIIDDTELYHLGASIKDLGKKIFGINKIEELNIIENFISSIKQK